MPTSGCKCQNAVTGEARRETALLRKDEPWFGAAFAALEAIIAGNATDDSWKAISQP